MASYVPATDADRAAMLQSIGAKSLADLHRCVPEAVRLKRPLNLPQGMSEHEVLTRMRAMATSNTVFPAVFRGVGSYRHFIPSIVGTVTGKETFLTAYTPYQAEISQGVLQAIFEFQTMICELTGMDASNASVYDGATAAGEAMAMCRERGRTRALVSAAVHPQVIDVVRTYCRAVGAEVVLVPAPNGVTDLAALKALAGDTDACLLIQQPNFYGMLEDADTLGEAIHTAGGKFVMSVNPLAAALLKTPADCGADIAVGDGQPLGLPMAFGGPTVGFMAAKAAMVRRLPGRIVGETTDHDGRRAFVLTLQAREQHIRREKASSNICSNQALCAMTASVYLAAMGPQGVAAAAQQSMDNAHALADVLCAIEGVSLKYAAPFFHEFVTTCPVPVDKVLTALEQKGILGGLPLENGDILWCATEMNDQAQIDQVAAVVKEVCA